jgi:hypothetical protein
VPFSEKGERASISEDDKFTGFVLRLKRLPQSMQGKMLMWAASNYSLLQM